LESKVEPGVQRTSNKIEKEREEEMAETSSFKAAQEVATKLKDNGFEAYLAGGCVRDLIIKRIPKDYDIATSATPEQVTSIFPHCVEVGAQFGVIKVLIDTENGHDSIEVATYRSDGKYGDSRRPNSVQLITNKLEDVKRRDFTMNGLLMDPNTGGILDYVGGREDINKGIIRCIGNPKERLSEDPARMLRAIRFVSQLGFSIEPETFEEMRNSASMISHVSVERVRDELTKTITGVHVGDALIQLQRSHLYDELPKGCRIMEILPLVEKFDSLKEQITDPIIAWSLVARTTGTGTWRAEGYIRDLRFSSNDVKKVVSISEKARKIHELKTYRTTLADKRRLANSPDINEALMLYELEKKIEGNSPDEAKSQIKELQEMGFPEPFISGNDLIYLGYLPGPSYTEIIKTAFDYQLNNSSQTKEEVIKYITDVHYKHTLRLLDTGFFSDGTKKRRMTAECKGCSGIMRFTSSWSVREGGTPLTMHKDRILEATNCENDTWEYIKCKNCGKKRAKDNFIPLKD
jgi:poly(A) polymerase